MTGTLDPLFIATVLFVGGHFLFSSHAPRRRLVDLLSEQGFLLAYSIFAGLTLWWMVTAFSDAPFEPLWNPPAALAWGPIAIMPVALFLAVAGLTTPNPTLVGGERFVDGGPEDPAPGILRITRHPFLWGVALWAFSHLLVNGDAAAMIFFGGFLILALGGMWHIDQKRELKLGAHWGPIKLTTSAIPFAALAAGRTRMDWPGIGWWRPVVALVLYAVLVHFHVSLFGASPLPA